MEFFMKVLTISTTIPKYGLITLYSFRTIKQTTNRWYVQFDGPRSYTQLKNTFFDFFSNFLSKNTKILLKKSKFQQKMKSKSILGAFTKKL